MKTFYLFRHGDTYQTLHRLPYGEKILTEPIDPGSIGYIKKMGEFLKDKQIDYFASSQIIRCQQTAEIISSIIGIPFHTDKRLNEFDEESPLTPEPISSFIERMESFLSDMQDSQEQHIAVCTHGSGTAALMHLLKNGKIENNDLLHFPAPGQIWIITGNKWSTQDFR